jgi:ARC6-like, IMS domain
MLTRNQELPLIEKLNNRIVLLYRKSCQVASGSSYFGDDQLTSRLEEYFRLKDNSRIPCALHYVVLASIANEYNLYGNSLEEEQLSALILAEMESIMVGNPLIQGNSAVLIVGLQVIKSLYPILYRENKHGFSSIEKAAVEMLDSNPVPSSYHVRNEPIQQLNINDDDMFDFIDVQTKVQTKILDENIVIPKKRLWLVAALSCCFGSGIVFNVLSNNYLGNLGKPQLELAKNNISKNTEQVSAGNINKTVAVSGQNISTNQPDIVRLETGNIGMKDSVVVSELIPGVETISQIESLNLVKRFLENKPQLFAPPYNKLLAAELMTGEAYNTYVLGNRINDSKENSIEWLQNNGCYYQYGVLLAQSIQSFQSAGNQAVLEVRQLEEVKLYDQKGLLCQQDLGAQEKQEKIVRYSLVKQNGIVKIASYNNLDQSRRKI